MPFGWPDLLRSIVDGKYFLKQFLREENDEGVFLADAPDDTPVEVRLARERSEQHRLWPQLVERSAELEHPNLLRYIAQGEARIDGHPYAYLVREPVQERLAEVLAGRHLEPDEARFVVESVMSAVDHLHRRRFMHGSLVPASIVAAGDSVKLSIDTLRPLPADELEARRAVTADLREFAETTTELLTGKRELGAGSQLPPPFRDFVRASFGTEECPSPTAAQLVGVLNGEALATPKPVVVEPAVPAAPVVDAPAPLPLPASASQEPVRFRPGMTIVAIAVVAVLAIAFLVYRFIRARSAGPEDALRGRSTVAEPVRPSPVAPAAPARVTEAPRKESWAVVAAAYNNYDAAARRAQTLSRRWNHGPLRVYPERGRGSRYLVIVASGLTQKDAERLRSRARRAGLPRDSYVTKLRM